MTSLAGKTAFLTGANRGMGLAIAQVLGREGVRLAMLGRSRPAVTGEYVACDLADSAAVPTAAQDLLKRIGPVDFLIHNAGSFLESAVSQCSLEDWDRIQRINLTAPFLITREVLPGMIARRQGHILNIASTSGIQGYLHQSAYCASKHGLLGFARSLAIEAKPHNVHVHTLCPGGVDTDLIKGTQLGERLKGQSMINPDDIAEWVLFLLRQPENIDVAEVVVRRFDGAR